MYNLWLPFLPGSTSALMAVFLAGRTFGFKLFPVAIFLIFPWLFFLFFLFFVVNFYYFPLFEDLIVIFAYFIIFSCFWPLSSPFLVSVALLDDCPGLLLLFVVSSGSAIPHLQALRLLVIYSVSPVPVSIFSVFSI